MRFAARVAPLVVRSAVAFAMLGGCQLVFPFDGTPDATDVVPPGMEAGVDVPADPNDRDGDGILNELDNCPDAANVDQGNEDFDALGNRCDNCPHIGNDDQFDTDGDQLGEECELGPQTHCIAMFDGFESGLQEWTPVSGLWSASSELQNSMIGEATLLSNREFRAAQVFAVGRLLNVAPTTPIIGIYLGVSDIAPITGLATELHEIDDAAELRIVEYGGSGMTVRAPVSPPQPLQGFVQMPFDTTFNSDTSVLTASAVVQLGSPTSVQTVRDLPSGRVGFHVNTVAGFEYILVVERTTGTCPPR